MRHPSSMAAGLIVILPRLGRTAIVLLMEDLTVCASSPTDSYGKSLDLAEHDRLTPRLLFTFVACLPPAPPPQAGGRHRIVRLHLFSFPPGPAFPTILDLSDSGTKRRESTKDGWMDGLRVMMLMMVTSNSVGG